MGSRMGVSWAQGGSHVEGVASVWRDVCGFTGTRDREGAKRIPDASGIGVGECSLRSDALGTKPHGFRRF